ncbi:tripartite tricarboxylate transporter substrate binding protein [Vibrio sp. VB16]|uniref:tripartite tricarboxylate transporter substrate binding protein n=1 Tax=Vibrio sp. VB16 TaxID=2785746 RepID=UPI00189F5D1E|nr:tripartite tricarboxylate transporter substrate binding protein [Vibrio sp. VB16]UGA55846.1 tripartite tricarboxylate transporter substrate binding protein [Vibrio sp. VB16]
MNRKHLLGLLSLPLAALSLSVSAAEFPAKPITLLMPWGPGGSSDTQARALANVAQKYIHTNLIVKNRTGAGGTIAATELARAKADGYTLMWYTSGVSTTQPMIRKVKYSLDDFVPVIGTTSEPLLLAVPKSSPYNTVADLKGHDFNAGSPGAGSMPNIAMVALSKKVGFGMDNVIYKSTTEANVAMIGGHIDISITQPSIEVSLGEKMRVLAVFTEERLPEYPDVPTVREAGFDLVMDNYNFIMAPKDTPKDRIETIRSGFETMLNSAEFKTFANNANITVFDITSEKIYQNFDKELNELPPLLKEMGIIK